MKKSAVFLLVALAVMCFARPVSATTPQCQAWLGAWTFNYTDIGAQPVRFSSVCDLGEACMPGTFYLCRAFGKRLFDDTPVTMIDLIFTRPPNLPTDAVATYEVASPAQTDPSTLVSSPVAPLYAAFTGTLPNDFNLINGAKDADCVDADLDGYGADCDAGADCDDTNAAIHPGATELCNGIDDNCIGGIDEGFNVGDNCTNGLCGICITKGNIVCADNQTASHCNAPAGLSPVEEIPCSGFDENCNCVIDEGAGDNKTYYRDADGDLFGNAAEPVIGKACITPPGYVDNSTPFDCADDNASINPDATEICNGKDDDCNSVIDDTFESQFKFFYLDNDKDGFGDPATALAACAAPPGYIDNSTGLDCNDDNASISPAARDVICNGRDENCSGVADDGYVALDLACGEDECAATGATACVAGVVQYNCTPGPGKIYYRDGDGDKYVNPAITIQDCIAPAGFADNTTGIDCNDNNSAVNPGKKEVCDNNIDENCDGQIDDNCTTPCTMTIVPKQIFKFAKFLVPFGPYVLIADTASGDDFGPFGDTGLTRTFRVRFSAEGIKTINGTKINKRIIIGFYFVNPFKLAKGDSTVEIEFYGEKPYTLCADFMVK